MTDFDTQRAYAEELAVEHDCYREHVDDMNDDALYHYVESLGFRWHAERRAWLHHEFVSHEQLMHSIRETLARRRAEHERADEQQKLKQWNTSTPIRDESRPIILTVTRRRKR